MPQFSRKLAQCAAGHSTSMIGHGFPASRVANASAKSMNAPPQGSRMKMRYRSGMLNLSALAIPLVLFLVSPAAFAATPCSYKNTPIGVEYTAYAASLDGTQYSFKASYVMCGPANTVIYNTGTGFEEGYDLPGGMMTPDNFLIIVTGRSFVSARRSHLPLRRDLLYHFLA